MEVSISNTDALPSNCLVSVRFGGVRRQAPLDKIKVSTLKFPSSTDTCADPLKIEVLQPIAHARLVLHRKEANYQVDLGGKSKKDMKVGVQVRHCPSAADPTSPANARPAVPAKYQDAAVSARDYLEHHGVLRYIQGLLHTVIQVRPEDPFSFMIEQLSSLIPGAGDPGDPPAKFGRTPTEAGRQDEAAAAEKEQPPAPAVGSDVVEKAREATREALANAAMTGHLHSALETLIGTAQAPASQENTPEDSAKAPAAQPGEDQILKQDDAGDMQVAQASGPEAISEVRNALVAAAEAGTLTSTLATAYRANKDEQEELPLPPSAPPTVPDGPHPGTPSMQPPGPMGPPPELPPAASADDSSSAESSADADDKADSTLEQELAKAQSQYEGQQPLSGTAVDTELVAAPAPQCSAELASELVAAPAQVSDSSEPTRETAQTALVEAAIDGRLLAALEATEGEHQSEKMRIQSQLQSVLLAACDDGRLDKALEGIMGARPDGPGATVATSSAAPVQQESATGPRPTASLEELRQMAGSTLVTASRDGTLAEQVSEVQSQIKEGPQPAVPDLPPPEPAAQNGPAEPTGEVAMGATLREPDVEEIKRNAQAALEAALLGPEEDEGGLRRGSKASAKAPVAATLAPTSEIPVDSLVVSADEDASRKYKVGMSVQILRSNGEWSPGVITDIFDYENPDCDRSPEIVIEFDGGAKTVLLSDAEQMVRLMKDEDDHITASGAEGDGDGGQALPAAEATAAAATTEASVVEATAGEAPPVAEAAGRSATKAVAPRKASLALANASLSGELAEKIEMQAHVEPTVAPALEASGTVEAAETSAAEPSLVPAEVGEVAAALAANASAAVDGADVEAVEPLVSDEVANPAAAYASNAAAVDSADAVAAEPSAVSREVAQPTAAPVTDASVAEPCVVPAEVAEPAATLVIEAEPDNGAKVPEIICSPVPADTTVEAWAETPLARPPTPASNAEDIRKVQAAIFELRTENGSLRDQMGDMGKELDYLKRENSMLSRLGATTSS